MCSGATLSRCPLNETVALQGPAQGVLSVHPEHPTGSDTRNISYLLKIALPLLPVTLSSTFPASLLAPFCFLTHFNSGDPLGYILCDPFVCDGHSLSKGSASCLCWVSPRLSPGPGHFSWTHRCELLFTGAFPSECVPPARYPKPALSSPILLESH